MKQQAIEISRDWLTMVLTGLGISFAPHQYFGGLFLALAAGSLIARHRKNNRKLFGIMTTAGVVATIVVLITAEFDHFDVAPQIVMAVAGAASSWVINIFVKVMDETQARSGTIAERVVDKVLPPKDGGGK